MHARTETKLTAPDQLPLVINISDYLIERNLDNGLGRKTAIYYDGAEISYEELSRQVNKVGNFLKDLGVRQEERVSILMCDCPEFVASFLATIKIGGVAVPMSTMLDAKDHAYMLNDSRARTLIADQDFLSAILSTSQSLDYLENIVVLGSAADGGSADGSSDLRIISYRQAVNNRSISLQSAATHRDDAAFWGYTSGSTGRPKGTIHLQHDIYYAAYYLNQLYYDIMPDDIIYSASKLFFAYGLGNSLWIPLFSGASAVLERRRSTPDVVLSNIRTYKPTKVFAVPTIYKTVLDYVAASGEYAPECDAVQRYYSAGEPLSKPLYEKWFDLTGREILTVLGSTEALQGYVGASPGLGSPGCLGKVIRGYRARVVDERGHDVPPHEKGVLMISGDSVASAYWNRHEESKRTFRGEWLYTGDMVVEGDDGIYWYIGRADEMFKVAGQWVSPTEIESVLATHPEIRESAIVACNDADGLTTMVAFVVCDAQTSVGPCIENAVAHYLKGRLPTHKCPRVIRQIEELPRSSTGKLQRFKLRELYRNEGIPAGAGSR